MEILFQDAKVKNEDGLWLCLRVDEGNKNLARRFVYEKKNRGYVAVLKEYRKKRSLDANAYCWVLIDKIASALGQTKETVYREAIRSIGGNSETVCVKEEAANAIRQSWERNGMGWITDSVPSKLPGCVNVVLYFGSSTYNTKQMSDLINAVVQDAQALGIETLTPDKLALLKEGWSGKE